MTVDAGALLDLLVAGGAFTVISAAVTALLNRRKNKISTEDIVQGWAMQLVEPTQRRLKETEAEIDKLRHNVQDLTILAARAVARAEAAENVLRQHNLPIPFLPPEV